MLYLSGTLSLKCRTSYRESPGVSCLAQGDKNEYVLGQELGSGLERPKD